MRTIFDVRPVSQVPELFQGKVHVVNPGDLKTRWCTTVQGMLVGSGPNKTEAMRGTRNMALCVEMWGGLAQIRVWKKNGTIQTEYTYGKDPARSKG